VTALTALTFLKTQSVEVGWFITGAVGLNTFGEWLGSGLSSDPLLEAKRMFEEADFGGFVSIRFSLARRGLVHDTGV
jgi:hypothetical protein